MTDIDDTRGAQGHSKYNYDVIVYDSVCRPFSKNLLNTPLGGSEVALVQLVSFLADSGVRVLCLNKITEKESGENFEYDNVSRASTERLSCKTLILSRYSHIPNIKSHRIVITGADDDPNVHRHQAGLLVNGDATFVFVSHYQASRFPKEWKSVVIRPFVSDYVLETAEKVKRGEVEKRRFEFVYPCAALKGLDATLEAWVKLYKLCAVKPKLLVAGSGYDAPSEQAMKIIEADNNESIEFVVGLSPNGLVDLLAPRHVFVVNAYREMFPMSFAIADRLGCALHVLGKFGLTGIREATNSRLVTTDNEEFERNFLKHCEPHDPTVSSMSVNEFEPVVLDNRLLISQWLEVLQLDKPRLAKKLCLSMIVKNEAPSIKASIDSTKPIIDSWCIVDTGSTDGTQEVIKDLLKDIPGALHERPWKNFGHNRSEAIALSKGQGDYNIWVDADDAIKVDLSFDKSFLIHDSYAILVEDSNITYPRPHVFRNDYGYYFEGVLHEFLKTNNPEHIQPLDEIIYVRSGSNKGRGESVPQTPEEKEKALKLKYEKDAAVLMAAYKENPLPRTVFYLAQSYKDAGNFQKALKYYQKRTSMGDYYEEVFFSLLQIAHLKAIQNATVTEVTAAYLAAFENLPSRAAEPLFNLAKYLRLKNRYALAYAYAKAGVGMSPPTGLFIDEGAYLWGVYDELAVSAFYIQRFEESAHVCEYLLSTNTLPESEVERVQNNLKFAKANLSK